MTIGVATEETSITIDQHQLVQVRAIVASGRAANVSAFLASHRSTHRSGHARA
jgi:Arc/MetJ-type ribon-helix-helix transcriptional regulator